MYSFSRQYFMLLLSFALFLENSFRGFRISCYLNFNSLKSQFRAVVRFWNPGVLAVMGWA